MVEFDGIYSMLFTGSFEVERGFVTAVRILKLKNGPK